MASDTESKVNRPGSLSARKSPSWVWLALLQFIATAVVLAIFGAGITWSVVLAAGLAILPQAHRWFSPSDDDGGTDDSVMRLRTALDRRTRDLDRERKELSTVMGAISDAILAVDASEAPLFFNSRFLMLFGGTRFSDRRPRLAEVFRTPEVLAVFRRALLQGEIATLEVALIPDGQGLARDFSISVAPLRREGESEEIYGAVGIFHDISELKRAERIRIDFVANVSHELRTPLTAIKGYAHTLQEDLGKGRMDSAAQFAEVIGRNSDRLMELIDDLLDLSSIESESGGAVRREHMPVAEVTARVFAQLAVRSSEKNQTLVQDTSSDARSVLAEPGKIDQVLSNLLENAIKYVPEGGKIAVRWEQQADAVLLHVVDNGPGIPPEHQPRLFERFYRVEQGRARDAGGTGLGLAIVKHIMQRQGGSVWVVSERGKGAEFVCRFPEV